MAGFLGIGGSDIGQALIRIGADTRALRTQVAAMNAQLRADAQATGQAIGNSAKSTAATAEAQANSVGKVWTALKLGVVAAGVAFAAFTIDAIKSARAFDQTMAQVYALTGATGDQMVTLRKQVLDLATVVPQSPQKLAEGLYYVLSSGIDAAHAMDVLKISAEDATVGMTDVQTIADAVTSVLNAYALSGDHAAEVSDIMTQAIVKGKAEWSDMAKAIGPVATQAATAGISFKEVASAIAESTDIGMTAQRSSRNLAFLIRGLEAPNNTAQKAFKSLGIEVNAVTLKQDGLMGTIEKIDKALGGHKEVIVKDKSGVIDWNKTIAATDAANIKWAEGMKAMTGGASGFLIAQILLNNGGKDYAEILKSMDQAQGLTDESFRKFAESDPGFVFDLLINRVQTLAIEFGNTLLPKIADFLLVLSDTVPAAMETVGRVFSNVLAGPLGTMVGAFGDLAAAILGVFGVTSSSSGDAFEGFLTNVAQVIAQLAKDATVVAQVLTAAFGNPVVQAITKVLLALKGAQLALGAIRSLSSGLAGAVTGTVSGVIRGIPGLNRLLPSQTSATSGDPALNASADNLTGAATALKEAAGSLKGGVAGLQARVAEYAGGNGALGYYGQGPYVAGSAGIKGVVTSKGTQTIGYQYGSYGSDIGLIGQKAADDFVAEVKPQAEGAFLTAVPRAWKNEYLANASEFEHMGQSTALTFAQNLGAGLRSGVGKLQTLGSGISKVFGGLSNLFFPAMIADLGIEFLKAPLGDFLAANTPWKRAANEMKSDFFGGLVDMVKSWAVGSDLFTVLPQIQLGTAKFQTENLHDFNLTDQQVGQLQQGGLAGTLEQQAIQPGVMARLQQQAGETVKDWFTRIQATLQANGLDTTAIQNALNQTITYGSGRGATHALDPAGQAKAQSLMNLMVNQLVGQAHDSVEAALTGGLEQALGTFGFSAGQVQTLPLSVQQKLAVLFQNGVDSQYSALQQWAAQAAVKAASAPRKLVLAKDVLAAERTATGQGRDESGLAVTIAAAANKAFEENLANNVTPAKESYEKFLTDVTSDPTGYKQALYQTGSQFIATWGAQIQSAKTDSAKSAIAKKLGMTWDDVLATFAQAQAATDSAGEKAMSDAIRTALLTAARDGSTEAKPQAQAALFAAMDPKTLAAAIADPNSKSAKDLRASFAKWFPKGDTAGTAKGFKDAYDAWVAAGMLDPTKPKDMQTAMSHLPGTAQDAATALQNVNDQLGNFSGNLRTLLGIVSTNIGSPGNSNTREDRTPTSGTSGYSGGASSAAAYSGSAYSAPTRNTSTAKAFAFGGYARGGELAWVNEMVHREGFIPQGSGHVLSVAAIQRLVAAAALAASEQFGAAAGPNGPRVLQHLDVDTMHVHNTPAEDNAILHAVEFLAPSGR